MTDVEPKVVPTCKIQWVSRDTGQTTPDENPAIGECWIVAHDEDNAAHDRVIHHDESAHFPICAEHAKQLPIKRWKFQPYLLHDDEYEGQRFVYGLTHRPLSYAAQPKYSIIGSNRPHPDFAFGTIEYPYELSEHDREAYELTFVGISAQRAPSTEDTPIASGFKTLAQVQDANARIGHHWFDPDTLRGFGSRIESDLLGGRYFVTSEQDKSNTGTAAWDGERRYSIRIANPDGSIVTYGEFGGYYTKKEALKSVAIPRAGQGL